MWMSATALRQKVEQAEMNLLEAQEAYDKAQTDHKALQLQALLASKKTLEHWRKRHEKQQYAETEYSNIQIVTDEVPPRSVLVTVNRQGNLHLESLKEWCDNTGLVLLAVDGGLPPCNEDGFTLTTYTDGPLQLEVAPKPGIRQPKAAVAYPTHQPLYTQLWQYLWGD